MDEEKKDLSLTEDQAQQMPAETKAAEEVQSAEKVTQTTEDVKEETVAEETVEETATEETITEETTEPAEEPAAEPVAEEAPVQTAAPAKSGTNIVGIVVGLLVFIGVLALCWKMVGPVGEVHADKGIAYAKDNNLYIYDLENDAYVAAEGISAGGQYNQYYSAWGTTFNEDGTTTMKPSEIILGKLSASFSTMFILIVSSFPLLAVSFVYGGITFYDVCLLLLCYVAVALLTGSMGICFSAIFKRSTIATVVTYGILILIAAGTYAVNVFALSIARMNMNNTYISSVGSMTEQANSGGFLYLLLFNPVATFYVMINRQAGDNQVTGSLSRWFGPHPENFIMNYWVVISIIIQLALSAIFLLIAIRAINPVKRKPVKQQKVKSKARVSVPAAGSQS